MNEYGNLFFEDNYSMNGSTLDGCVLHAVDIDTCCVRANASLRCGAQFSTTCVFMFCIFIVDICVQIRVAS